MGSFSGRGLLYWAYHFQSGLMEPVRRLAPAAYGMLGPLTGVPGLFGLAPAGAAFELLSRAGFSHVRPPYGIHRVMVGNDLVAVHEEPADVTPFGTLLHFRKDTAIVQPRVLVVAPLS